MHLHYQPKIDLHSGRLTGLEALARWNDQTRGFMSPGRFVPVLEDSNLTYKLDLYVLEEAAKLIKHQLDTGGKIVPISFNLSRTDFVTSDPNQVLLDLVKKYDIPREMLRVEITETILTEDPVKIKKAIDRFHADGFQVLMDDFGSGASSLNTLKEYGFDEIKLDMIFTRNFDDRSKKVIKPLISMAKSLGGGLPIGAVLMNEKVAAGMGPSSHGSTFGGNPVVCAGANVVVDRMDASFLANVNERAVQLRTGLEKLPRVKSLSGIGLMVGIEFLEGIKAADVLAACREKGLLVLTAKTRLRLLPPLTLTAHDVEMALDILGSVLAEMDPSKTEEQA